MKYTIKAFIGDSTEGIYMSVNADITINNGNDKEECHGSMVDIPSGSIEVDFINYVELVTFDIGTDITEQIKANMKKDDKYREYLKEAIIDFVNDNELYTILAD